MSPPRTEIDAWKEQLRLEGQACEGYTDGVLTALVFIITNAGASITVGDLAGFNEQDIWQLAVTAHHKRPYLVHNLPDAVRLSRGEFHAIRWGLERKTTDLPIGKDIFEITDRTHPEHGGLMSRTLQIIAYSNRFTPSARVPYQLHLYGTKYGTNAEKEKGLSSLRS